MSAKRCGAYKIWLLTKILFVHIVGKKKQHDKGICFGCLFAFCYSSYTYTLLQFLLT